MGKVQPDKTANYNAAEASNGAAPAIELTAPADCAGMRLDQVLTRLLPEYSRSRLQHWVEVGSVLVDGKTSESKVKLWGGERLRVIPLADPATSAYTAENFGLPIVFEDAALIV